MGKANKSLIYCCAMESFKYLNILNILHIVNKVNENGKHYIGSAPRHEEKYGNFSRCKLECCSKGSHKEKIDSAGKIQGIYKRQHSDRGRCT